MFLDHLHQQNQFLFSSSFEVTPDPPNTTGLFPLFPTPSNSVSAISTGLQWLRNASFTTDLSVIDAAASTAPSLSESGDDKAKKKRDKKKKKRKRDSDEYYTKPTKDY
ncbi:hypothetical protein F2Q69_00014790 [Brassica cretica]|uniref:Uncharacterized protein n=2 Tax=Brassica TaxID=3705 RepID=A0A8S9QW08_BRACR|nr:hypothetical protein F2Q69_00014790 [Brassica cretica]